MTPRRLVFLVPVIAACTDAPADPSLVEDWAQRVIAVARAEQLTAPAAARLSAYTAIALYEGYAADQRSGLRSLASQLNGLWRLPAADRAIDGATIGAQAAREVFDSLVTGNLEARRITDSLATAHIALRRAGGVNRERSEHAVELGRTLGRSIVAWAATDGFLATRGRAWTAPRSVAQWSPPGVRAPAPMNGQVVLAGAPASTAAVEPHWGRLRTFALRNADECAPPKPPSYSEARGSDFWTMGRALADSLARLTPETRASAAWWSSDALRAQATWSRARQQVVRAQSLSASHAAEAYALTSIAVADAYVGAWREKYRSMLVRPAVYLQRMFNASAPASSEMPASPEYPAEQAVAAAAAAGALISLFGDAVGFVDSSRTAPGAPRLYVGFAAVRDEMSAAAMFTGFHFMPAVVNGRAQGECIAERVTGRLKTRWQ